MRHLTKTRGYCEIFRCNKKAALSVGNGSIGTQQGYCLEHAREAVDALLTGINEITGSNLVVVEHIEEPDKFFDESIVEKIISGLEGPLKGEMQIGADPETLRTQEPVELDLESKPADDIPDFMIIDDVPDTNVAKVEPDGTAEHPFEEQPKSIADPKNLVELGSLAELSIEELLEIVKTEGVSTRAKSIEGLVVAITAHREV